MSNNKETIPNKTEDGVIKEEINLQFHLYLLAFFIIYYLSYIIPIGIFFSFVMFFYIPFYLSVPNLLIIILDVGSLLISFLLLIILIACYLLHLFFIALITRVSWKMLEKRYFSIPIYSLIDTILLVILLKIGYACINQNLQCRSNHTFRLKNYSKERLIEVIEGNLNCLFKILEFNKQIGINFFRITSDLIQFASHTNIDYNWQDHFKPTFIKLGNFIKENQMRISMLPGQYTVINSIKEDLDLMKLDHSAKVQIYVGGV